MTKKFDVVIGNPPYQEDSVGEATHSMPIYDKFMDAAYEVADKVVLITPARFLFNAGYTPKAWNLRMLADEHLSVAHYEADSNRLFPGLADPIKGGIAVTFRDSTNMIGPIGSFTKHPELSTIMSRVESRGDEPLERSGITSSRSYRYTPIMHTDHPGAADTMASGEQFKVNTKTFEQLHYLFHESQPDDGSDYARLLGVVKNRRQFRWIRRDYLTGPDSFDKWKVAVAKANGTGSTTDFFGVPLTNPTVLGPGEAVTQTFLTIGSFETEREAQALLNYLKSKFARTMLGVLKVTQDNPASTWKHVPNQDFTASSDIDWNKSIPEIDQQLYAKYGLDADEIAFIEEKVKPME